MTNQIPEEDRKNVEIEAKKIYTDSMWNGSQKRFAYTEGAEFGYTLGLQSAEKRVKELEDGLNVVYKAMLDLVRQLPTDERLADYNLDLCESAEFKAKQLLSK